MPKEREPTEAITGERRRELAEVVVGGGEWQKRKEREVVRAGDRGGMTRVLRGEGR